MKLETFFEKFDELADTPDGIKKTRELVLRLATTGHLIPTDGSGWAKVALNEIASARMGKTILKNELSDSGIPVYSAGRENTAWGFIAASDLTFRTGTIVVSARGTIGFPKIPAEAEFISTQTTIAITPTSEEIDSGHFCLQLQTVNWDDLTAKTAIPMITVKQVHAIEVRYPHSLAEQKRIVAKVDELMALCDRLEAQQQEREAQARQLARASLARFTEAPTPANLNHLFHSSFPISPSDLRKSILTLAVQGKLVPQDAEPSFLSLESILAEASVNGVSKGPTFDKSATEILRISAGTSRGDFYVNEDDFKHVDLPPDEVEKFQLAPGDLLACRFNGNLHYVGRFSYYRGESGRVQVNPDKLIRFRIKTESHCPRYVCLAMNAAPTREAIEAMCATTAGNIGLSAGRLKTVEIPIPPLAEQRRIVAKVSELMALVDELETQLAASRAAAEKLLSALVAELTVTTSRLPADS
jgi:type I restriction enzyme S subunit